MRYLFFTVLILCLTGCASSSMIVTGEKREAVSVDTVKVFTRSKPPADYEEVAQITAYSLQGLMTDQATLDIAVNELKEQAAGLGANGVILIKRKYVKRGLDSKIYVEGVAVRVK